jgi:hypothetical protein
MKQMTDAPAATVSLPATKLPLAMKLDAIAERYRGLETSEDALWRSLLEHDESFPMRHGLSKRLIKEFEYYRRDVHDRFIEEITEALAEGLPVDISGLSIPVALGLTNPTAPIRAVLEHWNSRALIDARDRLLGPNLAKTDWREAACRAARAVCDQQDAFNPVSRTVRLRGLNYREEPGARYRLQIESWDFRSLLSAFLNLAEAVANDLQETSQDLHPVAQNDIFVFERTQGIPSTSLFRWHVVNDGVVSRFRPYKDGTFVVEFENGDIVRRLEEDFARFRR